jgi:tetratricopeptide (TPR) repeat protein
MAGTLLLRAAAKRSLGQFVAALEDLEEAAARFRASECRGWVAVAQAEHAEVLARSGDWEAAADESARAWRELASLGQVVHAAQAGILRANAVRRLGKSRQARKVVRSTLRTLKGRGVPWLEYHAWRTAAELSMSGGRKRRALVEVDAAINALERMQGRLLTEARTHFLADKHDVYEMAVGLAMGLGDAARAFEYAERAKSRALVDALAGELDIRIRPRTPREEQLQRDLVRLRRRHDALAGSGTTQPSVAPDPRSAETAPVEIPLAELAACERQITAILDELRLANVSDLERVALLQGRTYPLQLDQGTVLIEYFAAGDDLCVFVQSLSGVTGRRLGGARSRIERLCSALQLSIQTTASVNGDASRIAVLEQSIIRILSRLHAELIAPIGAALGAAERLIVIPHGPLHRLPFAALRDEDGYLVEKYEVAIGPSASALAFCRRPIRIPKQARLVVGHSYQGNLSGAIEEANRIADVLGAEALLEERATRDQFVAAARNADIIHIAAHGLARLDAPLFSHVVLADGALAALDCFELELESSLVTLSACETGRADIAPGDEQLGLSRAFLYAGARSVVQTLWRVDDQTTGQLMQRFYSGLMSGLSRATALRAAQLEVLRDQKVRSHPFFWAPVVLIGDWGTLSTLQSRTGTDLHG